MIPAELAALAESPDAYTPLSPGFERVLEDRFSLLLGPVPHFTSVQRLRLEPGGVDAAVETVRGLVRSRGHRAAVWWLGDSTIPDDLHERLLERGFRPPALDPELVALALAREPEPVPGVEARPVETLTEYVAARELQWEAFGTPREHRDAESARAEELFRLEQEGDVAIRFVAFVDGRIAGSALGVFAAAGCLLVGGATAEWARGRGAYRALVRARWDESARRGAPGLAVAAAPTSEPILRRLGFEQVSRLRRLEDPETG